MIRRTPASALWISVVLWLGFSAWFFSVGPYGAMAEQGGIPDEDFFQSPSDVADRVAAMDETVRGDYQAFLWTDLLFAALYGGALWTILGRAIHRFKVRGAWALLVWTPVLGTVSDWLENASMLMHVAGWVSAAPFVAFQTIKVFATSPGFALGALAAIALVVRVVMNPVKRS